MFKKLITIGSLLLCLTAHAQHVTKDKNGNYTISAKADTANLKPTGHTITDRDGNVHPVYISQRGKLFWLRTSKNGKVYKSYIKEQ